MDWMDCHAFCDGQVDPEAEQILRQKIDGDPKLKAELHAVQDLKNVLASTAECPDCKDTWKSCVKRMDEIDKSKKVNWLVGRYAWGMCSVFFALILGAAMLNRSHGGGMMQASDVAYMASGLVPGGQGASVARNYAQKLSTEGAPEFKMDNLQVVSSAEGRIDGLPAVRFDLKDSVGYVTFIVVKVPSIDGGQQMGQGRYSCCETNRRNCITWTEGGFSMMLMGERPAEDLVRLADTLKNP